MPLYPYRCTQCGHKFEKIQSFNSEPEKECPKCHGVLERPLTAPGLQFKGAGWYVNDYASKGGASSSDSDSTKNESKTESTSEKKTESKSESKAAPASESAGTSASSPPSTTPASS